MLLIRAYFGGFAPPYILNFLEFIGISRGLKY
nr:MAG TPA: hypothetical protein [Caudoviricetes sp.]